MAEPKYDPPRIEQRTDLGPMLIGVQVNSANVDGGGSAVFRSI
jgi:hypothetical protein